MSKEQKQELKANGFIIVEAWQIVISLVTFIFIAGVFYAYTTNTLAQHTKQITEIEVWERSHQKDQDESVTYRNRKLDEVNYNLKSICRKLGVDYIEQGLTTK
jgi:hypothetical protein